MNVKAGIDATGRKHERPRRHCGDVARASLPSRRCCGPRARRVSTASGEREVLSDTHRRALSKQTVGAADHRPVIDRRNVALLLPPIISTRWQKLTSALLGRRRRSHDAYGDDVVALADRLS